jgi:kumamolisin
MRRWLTLSTVASIVIAGSPAFANVTVKTARTLQNAPQATRIGAVNSAAARHFTVLMRSGSAAEAASVAAYFRTFGLHVDVAADNESLDVRGTLGQAAAAGHTGFEQARFGTQTFVRASQPPQFPAAVSRLILGTSINPGAKAHSMAVRSNAQVVGPQAGYGPGDYASVYNINPVYSAGITGAGQTVDIAACFNINPSDIASFQQLYGLPNRKINVIHVDGTVDETGAVPLPDLEPTLDVERMISTAPGAKINLYVVPDCLISQFVDMFTAISKDKKASTMSVSYGFDEADYGAEGLGDLITAQSAAIAKMVKNGITPFASAGDDGSWGDPFLAVNFIDVSYPASDVNVISVGGTTLEENTIGKRLFEYAWSGTGGGVSGIFPIPSWQSGVAGEASGVYKNIPDVSSVADPNTGAAVYFSGYGPPNLFPVGGTSASSPTWAATIALINQARATTGRAPLIHVGDDLYKFRNTKAYTDITVGTNGYYAAGKGYDNATGIGVPDVAALVSRLRTY